MRTLVLRSDSRSCGKFEFKLPKYDLYLHLPLPICSRRSNISKRVNILCFKHNYVMYTRFGDVKFEFPATAAVRSEHQGPHFLVPIISQLWPSCVIILAFLE